MKKILSAEQTRDVDAYTIKIEPIASIDLMERASRAFVDWFVSNMPDRQVMVFCGHGNNGGDGLAIARMLHTKGWGVKAFMVSKEKKKSEDCAVNLERLEKIIPVNDISEEQDFPDCNEGGLIIIDAIFGSGLSRPVEGLYAGLIEHLNMASAIRVAVDIPSGLFADQPTGSAVRFKSDYCVTFQQPKLSFLWAENKIPHFEAVDIGLSKTAISNSDSKYYYVEKEDITFKAREKFAHKGDFGRVLLIAGSYGKMGAAVLAARACMRSGAGLLTVHLPQKGYDIVQTTFPEAMCTVSKGDRYITDLPDTTNYDVIGIGPGIGTNAETAEMLKKLFSTTAKPMALDADALNILSENPDLIQQIPKGSVFTPHPGEFARLIGGIENDLQRLERLKQFAIEHQLVVALKGAHTAVATPNGKIYFNGTGNPGMASGGSGDVLTGIITALLAQTSDSVEAAVKGVFIHGFAADLAANQKGHQGLIASDIIEALPEAFMTLTKN
ncbi:MAG TPA: bifunctional ADP-dependent NAD(P)H-hydrate dehydratase/NAD(P)H-hydrate epimerase [Cytophagales bacterium]|jgi:hydroxyethylthiazole kinase-like uncharacterized protein yjeF|nr:bifunctional ADP-dependent NAD(P)H-hydrate dehydratase/NAD(P)H-hydrate epimerase [Cytophagales bacterium]